MTSNIFSQLVYFFVFIYIARVLGPVSFGNLNWSKAIVQYFLLLSLFGLDNIAMIDTIKHKISSLKVNMIYRDFFINRLYLSLISYLLLLIFIFTVPMEKEVMILTMLVGLSIFSNLLNIGYFFRSLQQMEYLAVSEVIRTISYSLMLIIALSNTGTLYVIPIASFFAEVLGYLYLVLKSPLSLKSNFIIKDLKMLRRAYPFFISAFFATINLNVDVIIIGFVNSPEDVGLYSAAYKIVSMFLVVITFIYAAIKPVMIEDYSNKEFEKLKELVKLSKKIVILVAVPLAVAGLVISEEIITTLFGIKFKEASMVLSILLIYTAVLGIREIYGYQLIAYNFHMYYMRVVIISSMINIVLNLLLIPKYGIVAAAITSLLSELINVLLMRSKSNKVILAKLQLNYYFKLLIANVMLFLALFTMKHYFSNAIILTIIGFVIYLVLIFLTKTITINQIRNLKRSYKK